ncbi:hypothetical protein ABFS82_01G009600 [Erythranthe guttata]|uniref:PGG domain-containing protein n=1 Tax=Erythranthe guttata TaxID=4155 RepID=A0A022PWY5_ERYGU|nr:hypothetical protein MIMGU_mgv1a005882mg [Erythranthe guttata]
METLETKLFDAASKGSISSLRTLLKDDPLILDRVSANYFSETPLHVAAMLGHVDFVKEIVKAKLELTSELNFQQSSPLHLASAKGHVDVVKALLSVDHQTCLARDRNGLTPLHLAALKGRIEVMKILLRAKPEAAQMNVYGGENILHLCVKRYQLEPLKLLVSTIREPVFVNSKDAEGNTLLHLAVADKQVETINFLLTVSTLEVNALNLNGISPLDVLIQSRRDVRDLEIEDSLKRAGVIGANMLNQETTATRALPTSFDRSNSHSWKKLLKQQDDWLEKKKSALMIVASLIATMAFQVGVNPPSGVWQDDKLIDSQGNPVDDPHTAGSSVMANNYSGGYVSFYIYNTTGFIASLSIILLLMSGLPIRRRFFMWILMVITWVAITAVALTYTISILVLTPDREQKTVLTVIGSAVFVWMCLMALLLIGHTLRLVAMAVKKLRKRSRTRVVTATSSLRVLVNNVGV